MQIFAKHDSRSEQFDLEMLLFACDSEQLPRMNARITAQDVVLNAIRVTVLGSAKALMPMTCSIVSVRS